MHKCPARSTKWVSPRRFCRWYVLERLSGVGGGRGERGHGLRYRDGRPYASFWRLRGGRPRYVKDPEGAALRIPGSEWCGKDDDHSDAHHAAPAQRGQRETVGTRRGQGTPCSAEARWAGE